MKTSLKWYCESSPVFFLRQYTFRDTKITFSTPIHSRPFYHRFFMWDSSLRTHPGLNIPSETKIRTVELLCSHFVVPEHTLDCEQFLFCWKIREEKHKDERKENATQVQAVISVRDLRNRTSRSQSRSHVDYISLGFVCQQYCTMWLFVPKKICFRYIKFAVPRFIGVKQKKPHQD